MLKKLKCQEVHWVIQEGCRFGSIMPRYLKIGVVFEPYCIKRFITVQYTCCFHIQDSTLPYLRCVIAISRHHRLALTWIKILASVYRIGQDSANMHQMTLLKSKNLSLQNSSFVLKALRAFLSFKTNLGKKSLQVAHFGQLSLKSLWKPQTLI